MKCTDLSLMWCQVIWTIWRYCIGELYQSRTDVVQNHEIHLAVSSRWVSWVKIKSSTDVNCCHGAMFTGQFPNRVRFCPFWIRSSYYWHAAWIGVVVSWFDMCILGALRGSMTLREVFWSLYPQRIAWANKSTGGDVIFASSNFAWICVSARICLWLWSLDYQVALKDNISARNRNESILIASI